MDFVFAHPRNMFYMLGRCCRDFLRTNSICARSKASHRAPADLCHPLPIPSRPWSHIAMGFVNGLPPSDGNTHILIIHFVPLTKCPSALEISLSHMLFAAMVFPRTLNLGSPICLAGVEGVLSGSRGLGQSINRISSPD